MRVLPLARWFVVMVCLGAAMALWAVPRDIRSAAAEGDLQSVTQLVKVDPKLVNAADDKGLTPLIIAAAWGHLPVVTYLLNNGADVNLADKDGRTALHWAAAMGRAAVMEQLLTRRPNTKLLDRTGRTALQVALDEKKAEVSALLEAYDKGPAPMADPNERAVKLKAALAQLGTAKSVSLSWSVVELSPEVMNAGRPETLEADTRELTAKGLADGLLAMAKAKGKIKGLQYLVVVVTGRPAPAVLEAALGAPDARETDEVRDPEQADGAMLPVTWLEYGWAHFGVIDGTVRLVRADCPMAVTLGQPKVGQVMMNQKDGADVVFVPAGEFTMGNDKGDGDEKPIHKVYLDGFWIYKYEVTVAQFKRFCNETGRQMPRPPQWGWIDTHPMVNVTYQEAVDYAKWAGGRLPTEAEWEKACRGDDGRKYPWGNEWDVKKCNCADSGFKKTVPVGSYPNGASPYGVEDLAGNVYELCQDWYLATYYWNSPAKNPTGPEKAPTEAENYGISPSYNIRGGSFAMEGAKIYAANRKPGNPLDRSDQRGFRVLVPAGPGE